ncbi:MAG: FHA domain-containing protein [Pseudomonadota bacterium]|nr:FHA domain-containing protein [Pseudomonadota bacterium]
MNEITLHAPGTPIDALRLTTGRHAIGRADDGSLERRERADGARVCLCVDRRGVWLTVGEGVRGVHVNGRPVQRQALLRTGDCIHVDGHEIVLARGSGGSREAPPREFAAQGASDPRIVLRGIGGHHHGRSFTLDRQRVVGSGSDADIRIDDPAFAPRHARIGLQDGMVVLQSLGDESCLVNGQRLREAVLQPGDQIVFDDHHRFVIEAPLAILGELPMEHSPEMVVVPSRARASAWRLPWLLLAAVLLAAALSALFLL